jgi:hypothetical protein
MAKPPAEMLKTLQLIRDDMENDVKEFNGKPFNGRTVGEMHGQLCAAISALAGIIAEHIKSEEEK